MRVRPHWPNYLTAVSSFAGPWFGLATPERGTVHLDSGFWFHYASGAGH